MIVVFHPEAEVELQDAVFHYDLARPGLGDEFAGVVQSRVQELTLDPSSWPVVATPVRRSPVPRFPFDLLFAESAGGLTILAVMHHHRRPGYWMHRAPDHSTGESR